MSDAVARPPDGFKGFVLREKFRVIEFDKPEYEGLWAEIRTNLTHAERDEFFIARDQIDQTARSEFDAGSEQAKKLGTDIANARTDKERTIAVKKFDKFLADRARTARELGKKKLALVAPYVRAWNVSTSDYQDVPPPSVDLDQAFAWIDDVIIMWLFRSVEEGYRGGPKDSSSSKKSSDAPEQPLEPTIENERES